MPWRAIRCRQPRYPRKNTKDRRFCDPALRRVCLCQRMAAVHRVATDGATPSPRHLRSPPFPGSSLVSTVGREYRCSHQQIKAVFVAIWRLNASSACPSSTTRIEPFSKESACFHAPGAECSRALHCVAGASRTFYFFLPVCFGKHGYCKPRIHTPGLRWRSNGFGSTALDST